MKRLYTILFALITTITLCSAKNISLVNHLSIEDGLTHYDIEAIIEDSRGYIWIGGYDGLNRYNGYDITVYQNNATQTILNNNRILDLCEDPNGNIWIATDQGVTLYDYDREQFIRSIDLPSVNKTLEQVGIEAICYDTNSNNIICLTSNKGLLVYSLDMKLIRNDVAGGATYKYLYHLDNSLYIVAGLGGVNIYNAEDGSFKPLPNIDIKSVLSAAVSDKWIYLCDGEQSYRIEYWRDRDGVRFALDPTIYYKMRRIKAMFTGDGGELYIAVNYVGLYMLDREEEFGNEMTLVQERTNTSTLLSDSKQRLWFGTHDSGVYEYSTKPSHFRDYKPINKNLFSVWNIMRYDSKRALVKYNNSRYMLYNIESGESEPFPIVESLQGSSLLAIDNSQNLYAVVTVGNECHLMKNIGNRWHKIEIEREGIAQSSAPKEFQFDAYGNIWLIYQFGLYRLRCDMDSAQERYIVERITLPKAVDQEIKLFSLALDRANDRVWVGTSYHGLYAIDGIKSSDADALRISQFYNNPSDAESLPCNFVSAIVPDSDTIWVGTESGGVAKGLFNSEGDLRFERLTTLEGLSHNVVKSIIPDNRDNLWIGTNNGLSVYNKESNSFHNLYRTDGLPFSSFRYSAAIINDNNIVMAGLTDIVTIQPNNIDINKSIPLIEFSDFRIYNEPIKPNKEYEGRVILDSRLKSGSSVELKYNQNILSLRAVSLHYGDPALYHIKYRLTGMNDEWVVQQSNNSQISFNGLPSGRYTLEVAAANSDGEWGEVQHIGITINPPFWKRWWAYLLYAIVAILLFYLILRFVVRLQSLNHALHIESINKDVAAEKQQYFMSIAHEIKTPLSMVIAANSTLTERYKHDSAICDQLRLVERQSNKISSLIDSVHGIQLSELGLLIPHYTLFEFNRFIDSIALDFKYLSASQNKHFTFDGEESLLVVRADLSMVEKVICNLLNNAHKYSTEGCEVTLRWRTEGERVVIEVEDNGIGITPDELPRIFDRYYRGGSSSRRSELKGLGIGLSFSKQLVELHQGQIEVDSELNRGSRFRVELPIVTDESVEACESRGESAVMLENLVDVADYQAEIGEYSESLLYLVEDDDELRGVLERIVSKFFKVRSFANGAEALDAVEVEWPDVILSDVMMPEVDGYELCRRVKEDINTCHIPVILLTACTMPSEMVKCREVGADIYISKPFYPKYVIACIRATLGNYRKMQSRFQTGGAVSVVNNAVRNENHNKFMTRLYELLNENIGKEEIDFVMFSKELCVNRSLFFRKVKAITGTTPYELVKEYRLTKAAEMLSRGDCSVEDLCVALGFKSRTHFSKLFKDKYGVPPSKYKPQG